MTSTEKIMGTLFPTLPITFLWREESNCFFLLYKCLQGIEYLVTNTLLNYTPEDIAHFLFNEEGLNKTMIGNYLGEK